MGIKLCRLRYGYGGLKADFARRLVLARRRRTSALSSIVGRTNGLIAGIVSACRCEWALIWARRGLRPGPGPGDKSLVTAAAQVIAIQLRGQPAARAKERPAARRRVPPARTDCTAGQPSIIRHPRRAPVGMGIVTKRVSQSDNAR
ncbi:unnamed protein product, partial [Iphiclides podalirius]